MTKLEEACEAITDYVRKYHGEEDLIMSWREVNDLVRQRYPDIDQDGSNMHPSDICYNRANGMHKTKRFDKWPHALIKLDRAKYQLVGKNYPYTGYVFDAQGDVYGFWKNGIYSENSDYTMFDPTTSKQVILDNYSGKKGTFIDSLNDESCFRTDLFWELYESIAALVEHKVYSDELSAQISFVYQRMLKEMIWHFSPTDSSVIANMPENYDDYIERMDSAVEAYMRRTRMPDEEVFELRRPDME